MATTRLKGWDYAMDGCYFVTICTKDQCCFFGDVEDGRMILSPVGEIVAEEWQKTEQIRPHVDLDEWVMMPNHVHALLLIKTEAPRRDSGNAPSLVETPRRGVSTMHGQLQPNSLGSIVNQFKSVCTKRIRRAGFNEFAWQSRFYDHIVRDEESLSQIREYVKNKPAQWQIDELHPANL